MYKECKGAMPASWHGMYGCYEVTRGQGWSDILSFVVKRCGTKPCTVPGGTWDLLLRSKT